MPDTLILRIMVALCLFAWACFTAAEVLRHV